MTPPTMTAEELALAASRRKPWRLTIAAAAVIAGVGVGLALSATPAHADTPPSAAPTPTPTTQDFLPAYLAMLQGKPSPADTACHPKDLAELLLGGCDK